MKKLADDANIVALAVRYKLDFSKFFVMPINENARHYIPVRSSLCEKDFVKLLYKMRGEEVPQEVLNNIGIIFIEAPFYSF